MGLYDEFVQMAKEMIQEAGVDCKLVLPGTVAYDPEKPWNTAGDKSKEVIVPIRLFFSKPKEKTIGGSIVSAGEMKAIAAPFDQPIDPANVVSIAYIDRNGEKWKVSAMEVLKPADVEVLYTFKLGK